MSAEERLEQANALLRRIKESNLLPYNSSNRDLLRDIGAHLYECVREREKAA